MKTIYTLFFSFSTFIHEELEFVLWVVGVEVDFKEHEEKLLKYLWKTVVQPFFFAQQKQPKKKNSTSRREFINSCRLPDLDLIAHRADLHL